VLVHDLQSFVYRTVTQHRTCGFLWRVLLIPSYTTVFWAISNLPHLLLKTHKSPWFPHPSLQHGHLETKSRPGHVGGVSCTDNMTCTGGCKYSFMYSWWWVWMTPETCRVILQWNKTHCVLLHPVGLLLIIIDYELGVNVTNVNILCIENRTIMLIMWSYCVSGDCRWGLGFIPGWAMWYLWLANWRWGTFISDYFCTALSTLFHHCSTINFIFLSPTLYNFSNSVVRYNPCLAFSCGPHDFHISLWCWTLYHHYRLCHHAVGIQLASSVLTLLALLFPPL
jgi:hypothetical protein